MMQRSSLIIPRFPEHAYRTLYSYLYGSTMFMLGETQYHFNRLNFQFNTIYYLIIYLQETRWNDTSASLYGEDLSQNTRYRK